MGKVTYRLLNKNNLFAFADNRISIKPSADSEKFHIGKRYTFNDVEYIDNQPQYVFELISKVKEVDGVAFDGVVMKPIVTPNCSLFTLSRVDCNALNIEYQEGLILYPTTLDWKELEVKEEREFNDEDLSTYPVDKNDETIHRMIVRLVGFRQENSFTIRTPFNSTVNIKEFMKSLSLNFIKDSIDIKDLSTSSLRGTVITKKLCHIPMGYIVDNATTSIFIEVDMSLMDMSNNKVYGIDPQLLKNKTINDIFQITWIENEEDVAAMSSWELKSLVDKVCTWEPERNFFYSHPREFQKYLEENNFRYRWS